MKYLTVILAFWISGLFPVVQVFSESETGLATLEELVGQWTDLRKALADEKRDWAQKKRAWTREMDILNREINYRREELTKAASRRGTREEELDALRKEKEKLETSLNELKPLLKKMEHQLVQQWSYVPISLREKGESVAEKLSADSGVETLRVVDRLQNVVTLMVEIERLQGEAHVVTEMISNAEGTQRQFDVVYFGLSHAVAVSLTNDATYVGGLSGGKWEWRPYDQKAAQAFRSAVTTLRNEDVPVMITLPFQLQGEQP